MRESRHGFCVSLARSGRSCRRDARAGTVAPCTRSLGAPGHAVESSPCRVASRDLVGHGDDTQTMKPWFLHAATLLVTALTTPAAIRAHGPSDPARAVPYRVVAVSHPGRITGTIRWSS